MKPTAPRLSRLSGEGGFTLVELSISLMFTLLIGGVVVAWIGAASSSVGLHQADDAAVQNLRVAKEQLGKELRRAGELINASSSYVAVWLDEDADLTIDTGETVTWTIGSDGSLVRSTDAGDSVEVMAGLVVPGSSFSFDSPEVASITRIRLTLVAMVDAPTGTVRTVSTEIQMRNT
ncbi:MAG: hypothetical protein AAB198_00155 [Actinomycetota bacterium]